MQKPTTKAVIKTEPAVFVFLKLLLCVLTINWRDIMLPENILEDGLEIARGAMIFGVAIDEMTIDELKAVAALGWKSYNDQIMKTPSPFK